VGSPPIIDLLSSPLAEPFGVAYRDGVLTLERPWGSIRFPPKALRDGWYVFSVDEACHGACLQLTETSSHIRVELSAAANRPAYVRLGGGTYVAELFAGVRPGDYPLADAALRPLSAAGYIRLMSGRFSAAIRSGASPVAIARLLRKAMGARGTFGVRAAAFAQSKLGVLTGSDFERHVRHPLASPSSSGDGMRVYVRAIGGDLRPGEAGLTDQTYRNFSLTPEDCTIELVLGKDERLTPDALAMVAATFAADPGLLVAIADKWVDGIPTMRCAFDPLLYGEGEFSTPFARRLTQLSLPSAWSSAQSRFAIISAPIASGGAAHRASASTPSAASVVSGPKASIVIPTRDRPDLMRTCLHGLFDSTDWPHEVIVVDNGSVQPETFAVFKSYADKGLRVIRADMPFNFSALCNIGAEAATGDYLVFMNNDVVLTKPDWLAHMMRLASQDQVGAVGARLLYADKRLQHGGVALGLTQLCGHLWRGLPYEAQQAIPCLTHDSLRLAVTAALLCVDRKKFDAVGGFDEATFPVTLNDIDLCLKLYTRGWFNAYAAGAEAYHLEGESRGDDDDPVKRKRRQSEIDAFHDRWKALIDNDPWLPSAVSRSTETFALR